MLHWDVQRSLTSSEGKNGKQKRAAHFGPPVFSSMWVDLLALLPGTNFPVVIGVTAHLALAGACFAAFAAYFGHGL